ncbi:MAG: lipopolysaccharide biosynthesis protein [Hyphomicrobiales bacterium]|nr:MAG: lipopolysaccharide biosynthesis protein [Hyphomicrobiales bacterium]
MTDINPTETSQTDLRSVLRTGLSRSLASLLIKVATAGLTYGMYVAMSRLLGEAEYGYFAFGLSLATVLAIGASMGQQTAILRYWQEESVGGRPERARQALRAGGTLTVIAGLFVSLALLAVTLVVQLFGEASRPVAHLYAAAALILPMALAEYWGAAVRAQGSVWTSQVPRDIVWRVAAPLAVVGLYALGDPVNGWQALLITALTLALALVLQYAWAERRGYQIAIGANGLADYWAERKGASRWFLLGTVIDSAALNMDTIFVGLLVTPEDAGTYFNAFRTAGLLTLFMFALTLVLAPMVARHYHAGEMRKAQAITALCAWAGFGFSLVVFVGFYFFGDLLLSLFGGRHEDGWLILMLLSVGLLFDAATGPSRIVMMMTGHERDYVRIFGTIQVAAMLVQLAVIPLWGSLGAAVVNMLARIVSQLAIAWWSRRHIGLDTTLLGAFIIERHVDAPPNRRA